MFIRSLLTTLFHLGSLACVLACGAAPAWSASVEVDAATTHQIIDGFGSSARLFDDPHLFNNNEDPATGRAATRLTPDDYDEIMDLLYVDLGLTRLRPLIADKIERGNDNSDPYDTDLAGFDFSWKNTDGHVDHVAAAVQRGLHTFFVSPLRLERFMTTANPEEYVEWAMALLNRWRTLGFELPYYAILNEPLLKGSVGSPEHIRDVIKLLGAEMRAQNFGTMIVAADDVNSVGALAQSQVILADPEARQYIGAVAFHLYRGDYVSGELRNGETISELSALAASHGLPLWMTEYSVPEGFAWGVLMHELLVDYDVAAVDILFGAFGQQAGDYSYLRLLDENSIYQGPDPTKKYYYAGQFSRFVRRGAERIDALSIDPALKVSAYRNVGGELVVVAINTAAYEIDTTFEIAGAPPIASVRAVRTSDTENWRDLPPPTASLDSLSSSLPGRSFTTFVLPEPRRFAQQAAAMVALLFLGTTKRAIAEQNPWRAGASASPDGPE